MNYRFKMSIPEEKAYHEFLLEEFRKICLSAKSGEDIFGSSADVKAHTSMGNVYYAYFIGAKDWNDANLTQRKSDMSTSTKKLKRHRRSGAFVGCKKCIMQWAKCFRHTALSKTMKPLKRLLR